MPQQVVNGALLRCSQGLAPSSLVVIPKGVSASTTASATIMDIAPMTNIAPFGMCNSSANPQVIANTAAASGVHTPAPCQPAIAGPWTPGSTRVKVRGLAALTDASTCQCAWNGTVEITAAGPGGMKVAEQ